MFPPIEAIRWAGFLPVFWEKYSLTKSDFYKKIIRDNFCPGTPKGNSGFEIFQNIRIRKVICNYDDPEKRYAGYSRGPKNG